MEKKQKEKGIKIKEASKISSQISNVKSNILSETPEVSKWPQTNKIAQQISASLVLNNLYSNNIKTYLLKSITLTIHGVPYHVAQMHNAVLLLKWQYYRYCCLNEWLKACS